MEKRRQMTLHEKWANDSASPNGGIGFHDVPDTGKRIPMVGFSDEELKSILGEEEYRKQKEEGKLISTKE